MGVGQASPEGARSAAVARLQARGRLTVPEAVRRTVGLEAGDTLLVRGIERGRFEVIVVPQHTADDFFAAMALRDGLSFEGLRAGVAEGIAGRAMPRPSGGQR